VWPTRYECAAILYINQPWWELFNIKSSSTSFPI
jgi:hypothetical protein